MNPVSNPILNKTFCMAPWVHAYVNPVGRAAPCCISSKYYSPVENFGLDDIVNSKEMKQLRLDMINGVKNEYCKTCYKHEEENIGSSRQSYHKRFGHLSEEVLSRTADDGTLDDFKMKYFDARFSNICNFKCRTCNSEYSSLWEQEDSKRLGQKVWKIKPSHDFLINDIINQIPNMDMAYFAGGEPLITEEHYILLEEMIRQGRTNIRLQYNSNISNLVYKDKDLLDLWSKFEHTIEIWASIDHVGKRAEYIRHGTDWGKIESNLLKLNEADNVALSVNTVVSVFNYVTLREFYDYMINLNILRVGGPTLGAWCMDHPAHFNSKILPTNLKAVASPKLKDLINQLLQKGVSRSNLLVISQAITWTENSDNWEQYKKTFQEEIAAIDAVRNESFVDTFPELAEMMD